MHNPFLEKSIGIKGITRSLVSNRFAIDNIVMIGAMGLGNIFNYGYQLAMGMMLSAEDYGILLSLISFFVIVAVLTQTVTTVVAKTTATLNADNRLDMVGRFYRISLRFSFLVGIGLFAILALASTFITHLLNLGSALNCIILFSSFLFAFPLSSNWGILQGLQRFISLGSNQVLFAVVKVVFAVLLPKQSGLAWST